MRPVRPKAPVDRETHQRVTSVLSEALAGREEILLGYLHGSYTEGQPFRDLDVGVYVIDSALTQSPLSYELELESELESKVRAAGLSIPVDLRVLNRAPRSFRYQVIKDGTPVFVRDDDLRAEFEATTVTRYLDFAPFRREQLKEVLGHGDQ